MQNLNFILLKDSMINFWKRYRVNVVFPFHDVFLLFIFHHE